ncbi:hypothetical protein KSS87_000234 [Heliosperma pusillum]|nr:hypothetical protein KSS87_000234 [Heliosperma pusillum]
MSNIGQQSLSINAPPYGHSGGSTNPTGAPANVDRKTMHSAELYVLDLSVPERRENALLELSKKRELFQDLAPLLWNSFGTIAALLQVYVFPILVFVARFDLLKFTRLLLAQIVS